MNDKIRTSKVGYKSIPLSGKGYSRRTMKFTKPFGFNPDMG